MNLEDFALIQNYIKEHYLYLIRNSKYEGADLLRFFATIGVAFFHYSHISNSLIFRLGWTGVNLFFVLSGFLIGGAIIDEYTRKNQFSFSRFYKNRVLRIYPIYILATILTVIFNTLFLKLITFNLIDLIKQFSINLLFLQTYIPYFFSGNIINNYYVAGGTWSLAIEWFFYLICPLVLIFLLKITNKNFKKVTVYFLLIYFSAIFVRLFVTRHVAPNDYNWYFAHSIRFHSRYDELVAGVIIALIIRQFSITKRLKQWLAFISLLSLALFGIYFYKNPLFLTNPAFLTHETLYYPTWLSMTFGCLLLSLYNIKIDSPFVNAMARLSYPIYLLHIVFVNGVIPLDQTTLFVVVVGMSYFASLFIEYPFLRLYKRKKPLFSSDVELQNNTNI